VPAAATATAASTTVRCDNCGAPLSGRYCGRCGQRVEPPVHSLWHFTRVATEDLTHADSRVWRTLAALLFRPGYLTREFLRGRRASYLPPVRLYLVLSVVFFLWLATGRTGSLLAPDTGHASAAELHQIENEIKDTAAQDAAAAGVTRATRSGNSCQVEYDGPGAQTLRPLAVRACERIRQDRGRSLIEAFMHNLPRAMFLFLPLLAGAMKLMYWRPQHYYVEHLLLLVHNHAFLFVALMLAWALAAVLPFASPWVRLAMTLYIPWYLYRSMRVVYGQGRWLTLGKLTLLSFFYLVSGGLMLVFTTLYSAVTLG